MQTIDGCRFVSILSSIFYFQYCIHVLSIAIHLFDGISVFVSMEQ